MFVWTITDVVLVVTLGLAVLLGILKLTFLTYLNLRIHKVCKNSKRGKK